MNRAQHLYRLQMIDSQIDETKQYLARISANLGKSKSLIQAEQITETTNETLRQAQARMRNLELETKSLSTKIAAEEQKLYGGKTLSAKEAANMQEEIASLKRRFAQKEETLLEAMMAVEEAEEANEQAQSKLSTAKATWIDEQEKLNKLKIQFGEKLVQLDEQRPMAVEHISPADLDEYNYLRDKRAGRAVVAVKDGLCQACNVSVSNGKLQRARTSGELIYCDACRRILYA